MLLGDPWLCSRMVLSSESFTNFFSNFDSLRQTLFNRRSTCFSFRFLPKLADASLSSSVPQHSNGPTLKSDFLLFLLKSSPVTGKVLLSRKYPASTRQILSLASQLQNFLPTHEGGSVIPHAHFLLPGCPPPQYSCLTLSRDNQNACEDPRGALKSSEAKQWNSTYWRQCLLFSIRALIWPIPVRAVYVISWL